MFPRKPIISSVLLTLSAAMFVACSGGGNTASTPIRKWYEGGTLHEEGALEWQSADAPDKLATCADFAVRMWKHDRFVPRIHESIHTVDDLKPYAQELVDFIDAATEKDLDPTKNENMYANQSVSSIAVAGMISMGWVN